MVQVRAIEKTDEAAWKELWQKYLVFYKASLPDSVTETTFARMFDPNEPVHGAVAVADDGAVIGFVTWVVHRSTWSVDNYVYLHDLFVNPDARCAGTGRKLIEFVYEWARGISAARVYWHTQTDNHRAQLLYTKVGVRNGFISYQWPS